MKITFPDGGSLKCPYGKSTTEFTSENDRLFVKHGFACIPCVDESSPEDSPEQGKTYQEDSDKDEGLVIRFDPLHWKDEGRDADRLLGQDRRAVQQAYSV